MKKRITSVLVAMLCCLVLTIPAFAVNAGATSTLPRLVDDAQTLTNDDTVYILDKLNSVSEQYECDVVIVTIESLDGDSVVAYADDFFDYNGYGYGSSRDGILLLVSTQDREYAMSTSGSGIDIFTDHVLSNMENKFLPNLSKKNYYYAFYDFVESCEFYLEQAEIQNSDGYYDDYYDSHTSSTPHRNSFNPICIPIIIIISMVIAITSVNKMKAGLTSVKPQKSATNYVRSGSMKIRNQRESYLYNHVSKIRRDTDSTSTHHRSSSSRSRSSSSRSSTHRSSSGRRHGGSSGRF